MTDSTWRPVEGVTIPTRMRITTDNKLQVETVQHSDKLIVDHVADMDREIREHGRGNERSTGHYVGSVPLVVYEQWCREDPEIKYDSNKLMAKLKGADYSRLRVSP